MLLTLLPLLLQVVTATGASPPPGTVRASDSAISVEYQVLAYLHAEPPIRQDTPWFESLHPHAPALQAQLRQLGPDTTEMYASARCATVRHRRLRGCEFDDVRPDTPENRALALHLVQAMRVDAPSRRTDGLSVNLLIRNPNAPPSRVSICGYPFCMIEYGEPPPPPPPPSSGR